LLNLQEIVKLVHPFNEINDSFNVALVLSDVHHDDFLDFENDKIPIYEFADLYAGFLVGHWYLLLGVTGKLLDV